MASEEMEGPYPLDVVEINEQVMNISPGNYLLGYAPNSSTLFVKYVGRSDKDVAERLKDHVGKYSEFAFCYASSPKDAFERECEDYHDHGESERLDNESHPDCPDGTNWECPRGPHPS